MERRRDRLRHPPGRPVTDDDPTLGGLLGPLPKQDQPGTCHLVGCEGKGVHPPHGIGAPSRETWLRTSQPRRPDGHVMLTHGMANRTRVLLELLAYGRLIPTERIALFHISEARILAGTLRKALGLPALGPPGNAETPTAPSTAAGNADVSCACETGDATDAPSQSVTGPALDFGADGDSSPSAGDPAVTIPRQDPAAMSGSSVALGDRRPWQREDGDSRCQGCGGVNPVWRTADDWWNRVAGRWGYQVLCPTCFLQLADDGIHVYELVAPTAAVRAAARAEA